MIESLLEAVGIVYLSNFVVVDYISRDDSVTNSVSNEYFKKVMSSEKLVYDLFKSHNKENYFKIRCLDSLNFFLYQIHKYAPATIEELTYSLNDLSWFFKKCKEYDLMPNTYINQILFKLILDNDIESILNIKKIINREEKLNKRIFTLKNENKSLKSKVANLQTTKGWLKYKIFNIYQRIKKRS